MMLSSPGLLGVGLSRNGVIPEEDSSTSNGVNGRELTPRASFLVGMPCVSAMIKLFEVLGGVSKMEYHHGGDFEEKWINWE